jgi:hypothetical protein
MPTDADDLIPDDWIRAAVYQRAMALGLTAYAIARDSGGAVKETLVRRYLTGRQDVTSVRLGAILRVLGLELREKRK